MGVVLTDPLEVIQTRNYGNAYHERQANDEHDGEQSDKEEQERTQDEPEGIGISSCAPCLCEEAQVVREQEV